MARRGEEVSIKKMFQFSRYQLVQFPNLHYTE
jgi:hypothetical protein